MRLFFVKCACKQEIIMLLYFYKIYDLITAKLERSSDAKLKGLNETASCLAVFFVF
jgi:hypothetical protein